jgi:folate-dependent phosphoribosylglycinamide formyltransferase PurN
MKITVFTSNQPRHLNLIDRLSEIADECYAVVETNTVFPGQVPGFFQKSEIFQQYFSNVMESERKIFGDIRFSKNIHNLIVQSGDLNKIDKSVLEPALNSDVYVVFGSSFIKGWLIDHLVENNAINIHMGVSPYYRGSSCNFWALYDDNVHLMGATIHMLSKGLDSGDILYHVAPTTANCSNAFDFTMMSVKSAHQSLVERISSGALYKYNPVKQDANLEVRYSKNSDFTDEIAKEFLDRKVGISEISRMISKKQEITDYIEPYYLGN